MELKGCNPRLLDDLAHIRQVMIEAAEIAGATIVGETFHKFSPHGVTGVVAIAESHLCIHTWPEHGYAAVDIFTCGEALQPYRAARHIVEKLEAREPSVVELKRGIVGQLAEATFR